MQFGNLAHVVELDATVTVSPGMLAYVADEGQLVGVSFKTSPLTTKDVRGKQYLSSDIDSYFLMFCRIRICVMGPDGEKDCLSGLKHIDWIREVPRKCRLTK